MIEESTYLSNVENDEGTSSDGKNHLNEERNAARILCDVWRSQAGKVKDQAEAVPEPSSYTAQSIGGWLPEIFNKLRF